MTGKKPILAVMVLYRMSLSASPTYRTLRHALADNPAIGDAISLFVADNSPEKQDLPAEFFGRYLHDGRNVGLAQRYNLALTEAASVGAKWLLLLDQDTSLTAEYLEELLTLSRSLDAREKIVAIVPKLLGVDCLLSPHLPCYRESRLTLNMSMHGIPPGLVRVYNSGALVRIGAMQAMGGFPEAYWLDYLDHATFARLQGMGGEIYVMNACLDHDLSVQRPGRHADPAHAARHSNQLSAELRFYREHGDASERRRHRVHLIERAARSAMHGQFAEAGRLLSAAGSRQFATVPRERNEL